MRTRLATGPLPVAALLQVRGDWEWLCQCFRLRHYGQEEFCWLCNARSTGPLSYYNVAPDAPHRATLISHEAYITHCAEARVEPSALFSCPGFRLEYIAIDSMHAADLGVFQDAVGGLFWLEISNREWHPNRRAGLAWLQSQLRDYYRANPELARLHLTLPMLRGRTPAYPTLKAKAAQTRHVAGFALALAQRHALGDATRPPFAFRQRSRLSRYSGEYRSAMVQVCEGMVEYHRSCGAEPWAPARCRDVMYRVLQGMNALRLLMRRHLPPDQHRAEPFPLRPKAHMLQHLVEEKLSLWGSPRDFWCYGDEDFLGFVKGVAAGSRHPATLERVVLQKWALWSGLHAWAEAHGRA